MKNQKSLNEGLMDAIVGGIMSWAVKKDIAKDPEFRKTFSNYNDEIQRLSSELEKVLSTLPNKKKKK